MRFVGDDNGQQVVCGVTSYALKHCAPDLPHHGLLQAEAFISAFEKLAKDIHRVAQRKYKRGETEPEGIIRVMVHRQDLAP